MTGSSAIELWFVSWLIYLLYGLLKALLLKIFDSQVTFGWDVLFEVSSDRLGYYINFDVGFLIYFGLSEGGFFKRLRDDRYCEIIGSQFRYGKRDAIDSDGAFGDHLVEQVLGGGESEC